MLQKLGKQSLEILGQSEISGAEARRDAGERVKPRGRSAHH